MRRLRAPDKSGASESSAVLMEERETEEVGGRSTTKNTATVSAASLLPCIGVKAVVAVGAVAVAASYFSWPRGRISPPAGQCGEGSGNSFMWW